MARIHAWKPVRWALGAALSALLAVQPVAASLSEASVRVKWLTPNDGRPVVYLFQDIHGLPEAQRLAAGSLAGLLRAETPAAPVVVGVEGTSGPMDFSRHRRLGDAARRAAAADRFLSHGLIGPAARAGVTAPESARFTGLEDFSAYAANVAAYRNAMAGRARLADAMAAWKTRAAHNAAALRPPLRALLDDRAAHAAGTLSLGAYADRLAARVPLPPALAAFRDAWRYEQTFSLPRVRADLARLARRLADTGAPRLDGLTRGALEERHRAILSEARRLGVDLSGFPHYAAYVAYLEAAAAMDIETLLPALAAAEEAALASLRPDAAEAEVFADQRRRVLTGKLATLALTRAEWDAHAALADGLPAEVAAALRPFEDFYRWAARRDALMAARLPRAPTAAVVAGGFHTAGLAAAFAEQGRAVAVVTPVLTRVPGRGAPEHLKTFLRRTSALDRLVAGSKLFLALPEGLGPVRPQIVGAVEAAFEDAVRDADAPLPERTLNLAADAAADDVAWRLASVPAEQRFFALGSAAVFATAGGLAAIGLSVPLASAAGAAMGVAAFAALQTSFLAPHAARAEDAARRLDIPTARYLSEVRAHYRALALFHVAAAASLAAVTLGAADGGLATALLALAFTGLQGIGLLLHGALNLAWEVPAAPLRARTALTMPRAIAAFSLMDVGAEVEGDRVVYRNALRKMTKLLPILSFLGFGSVYVYGGLYEMGPVGVAAHQMPDEGTHVLPTENPGADDRVRVWGRGYRGREETVAGVTVRDDHGNTFAIKQLGRVNPKLSDGDAEADFDALLAAAHRRGVSVIVDFFAWLDPGGLTDGNYRDFIHRELPDDLLAEWNALEAGDAAAREAFLLRALQAFGDYAIFLARENGVERPVLVRHLSISGPHLDQVVPNIFLPHVRERFENELKALIDRGVDGVRIDLIHKLLRREMDHYRRQAGMPVDDAIDEPLRLLLDNVKAHAARRGRPFRVIGEAYNLPFGDRDEFLRHWAGQVDDIYYDAVHKDYKDARRGEKSARALAGSLGYLIQEGARLVGFPSNYDEDSLKRLGGVRRSFMALMALFAKAGLGVMFDGRELMDHVGHLIPVVGKDHPVPSAGEVEDRRRRDVFEILAESPHARLLAGVPAMDRAVPLAILNTVNQDRYIAVGGRTAAGDWSVSVTDFETDARRRRQPMWTQVPPRAMATLGLVDPEGNALAPSRILHEDIDRVFDQFQLVDAVTGAAHELVLQVDPHDAESGVRIGIPPLPEDGLNLFLIRRKEKPRLLALLLSRLTRSGRRVLVPSFDRERTAGLPPVAGAGLSQAGGVPLARAPRVAKDRVRLIEISAGMTAGAMRAALFPPETGGGRTWKVVVCRDAGQMDTAREMLGARLETAAVLAADQVADGTGARVSVSAALAAAFGPGGAFAGAASGLPGARIDIHARGADWTAGPAELDLGALTVDLSRLDVRLHLGGFIMDLLAERGAFARVGPALEHLLNAALAAGRSA